MKKEFVITINWTPTPNREDIVKAEFQQELTEVAMGTVITLYPKGYREGSLYRSIIRKKEGKRSWSRDAFTGSWSIKERTP